MHVLAALRHFLVQHLAVADQMAQGLVRYGERTHPTWQSHCAIQPNYAGCVTSLAGLKPACLRAPFVALHRNARCIALRIQNPPSIPAS